jgi:hypothetical protein
MPTYDLPIVPANKGLDTDDVWDSAHYDCYLQEIMTGSGPALVWRKRPGLTAWQALGSAHPRVNGIYYWKRKNILIAQYGVGVTAWNNRYALNSVAYTPSFTVGNQSCYFADVGTDALYLANGTKIGKWYYPEYDELAYYSLSHITDAQAPTSVRSVASIDNTLIALRENSGRFDWSDAGAPDDWSGEYATAEAHPDITECMIAANGGLTFIGSETIENFRTNGSDYVRETQAAISTGTVAQDSPKLHPDGFIYFLADDRSIARLEGYAVRKLSGEQLTGYIKAMSYVGDAVGIVLPHKGKIFYVLNFPTEQRTIAYDPALNRFYNWSYWDDGSRRAWPVHCAAWAEPWNNTYLGGLHSIDIWTLGGETDDGNPIVTEIATDGIDWGAPERMKFCAELIITLRRADGTDDSAPGDLLIRWRNDGHLDWHGDIRVPIEYQGRRQVTIHIPQLGCYHTRHWVFRWDSSTDTAIAKVQERFELGY